MQKILVIEDDADILKMITFILKKGGYEVYQAVTGSIGVQLAQEKQPDLILSDVMMPGMDGYLTLTALRNDERTRTIPFIFLTGKAEKQDLRRGMTLGADDYLTKPFTKSELLEAISTRLARQEINAQKYNKELQKLEERYNELINRDGLTGLPNLFAFRKSIQDALSVTREKSGGVAVLLIALGRLDQISQALGVIGGNELLRKVANKLVDSLVGKINRHTNIASLGNGQFAVLLSDISQEDEVVQIASLILKDLNCSIVVEDQDVYIMPFMGISISTKEQKDVETLLKQAGAALAKSRKLGLFNYQVYNEDNTPNSNDLDRLKLEGNLGLAVERNELELYYQPQVELKTKQIVGMEALLRWRIPYRGLVSPKDFIPLAEETGLIITIGEWVLQSACIQAKAWQMAGFGPLRVAVNISAHQFNHSDICKTVLKALSETALESQHLELELTESAIVQDFQHTIKTLNQLKSHGVNVSIDDFGTGYSSLSYLTNIPANNLKIDQTFIRNITVNTDYAIITKGIIEMAHNLNMKVIAEGVETPQEWTFLEQHRCDEMQGYLFSQPLPVGEVRKLLETYQYP